MTGCRRGGVTRPQSHTQPFSSTLTLHCGMSYLFFAFILETQTRRSLLKALAIVCPGLVRLELHCWGGGGLFGLLFSFLFFFFLKINPAKTHREEKKKLTAEPPHRCCSLHPWSEMVGNQRRKGLLERSQWQPSSRSWMYVLLLKKNQSASRKKKKKSRLQLMPVISSRQ